MRAVLMFGADRPMEVRDVELADPHAHEVRVRIAASGVCHSDVSMYEYNGAGAPLPAVMGHEAAGTVEAVGDGVDAVAPGDHVILTVVPQCGVCRFCLAGQPTLCVEGGKSFVGMLGDGTSRVTLDGAPVSQAAGLGAWSEVTVVPDTAMVKIDRSMPLAPASLLGCGVITGYGAATKVAGVQPGDHVAVVGCGGVGLSAVQGARIAGAERIIAIDLLDNKLEYARTAGATDTINSSTTPEVVEAVRELTGGFGVDAALDFVGNAVTSQHVIAMTRRGGRTVFTGAAGAEWALPVGELLGNAKTVRGNLLGMGTFRDELPKLVRLYQDGELKLDEFITRRIGLDDTNEAFRAMHDGEVARSVIEIA